MLGSAGGNDGRLRKLVGGMSFRTGRVATAIGAAAAACLLGAGPAVAAPPAPPPAPQTAPVAVPASSETVVDSGLSYSPGGTLRISATGTATYGGEGQPFCAGTPVTTPDGGRSVPGLACPPKVDPNATLPTAPIGSLIASIGIPGEPCSTGWFYAGSSLPAQRFGAAGEVYLLYNDSTGQYGNNSGGYTATVTVTAAPHPPRAGCGKVVDLEVHQTPKTPLWTLDTVVTLNPAQITCPATVTVASGLLSRSAPACVAGGSAPATLGVSLPVFEGAGAALQPGARNAFTVTVADAHGRDILDKDLSVPPAPAWYGLGDSYSSAFSWFKDRNDRAFSFVTRAANALNAHYGVPPQWRMTPDIVARSGATTEAAAGGQLTAAATALGQHEGSWNVASVTGGADDADFAGPAFVAYEEGVAFGRLPALNDITDPQKCPDQPASPADPGDPMTMLSVVSDAAQAQQGAIAGNLATIFTNLRDTDPDLRIADVTYPYVVGQGTACFGTSPGVRGIIDTLDSAHIAAGQSVSGVALIDLRDVFGFSPVTAGLINRAGAGLPSTASYPHPTGAGQQAIAMAAAQAIEQANP